MMSASKEDIILFIRDFEASSRDYLQAKGLSEQEMTNAYLDLQWDFLHTILSQAAKRRTAGKNTHRHMPYDKKRVI